MTQFASKASFGKRLLASVLDWVAVWTHWRQHAQWTPGTFLLLAGAICWGSPCQASNQSWTTVTNYIAKISTKRAEEKITEVKAIATKVRMMTGNVLPPKMLRFAQTK